MRPSILCKYLIRPGVIIAKLNVHRRTYSDQEHGQVIRDGFEPPSKLAPSGSSEFAVGDDEDEGQSDNSQHESDEDRQWKQGDAHDGTSPKKGSKYDSLDDGNVWSGPDRHET